MTMQPGTVAAVRVDITPPRSLPLSGYGGSPRHSTGVAQLLEANVLVMQDEDGPFYLVAVDALYGGALGGRISDKLGCPRERVLVLGSHTHFAPGVDPDLSSLGATSKEYVDWVAGQVVVAIDRGHRTTIAMVGYGEEVADGLFVNRRLPVLGAGLARALGGPVRMAPYPKGRVDDVVRVVAVIDGERTVAVLWGASCHPVCTPDPLKVSSAFPGVVRDMIRERVGDPELPVLFLQGFSGDVRPASYRTVPPKSPRGIIQFVANHGKTFRPQGEEAFRQWCGALGGHVLSALGAATRQSSRAIEPSLNTRRRQPPGWARGVSATRVGLAPDIHLIAVNAEVVNSRVDSLRDLGAHIIPVGCADEVIGYWPTDQMLREGGYEGCLSQRHFPNVDWLASPPDRLWQELIDEL